MSSDEKANQFYEKRKKKKKKRKEKEKKRKMERKRKFATLCNLRQFNAQQI